jgi:hypothetical protein
MRGVTRRSLIRSSAGLVAAGALTRPYLADAAATEKAFTRVAEIFAKYPIAAG